MNSEKFEYYRNLLKNYRTYILFHEKTDMDICKLQNEVNRLAEQEYEFENLLVDVDEFYWLDGMNKASLTRMLRDFSGKRRFWFRKDSSFFARPSRADDTSLRSLAELYLYEPQIQKTCETNEVLHSVMSSWLEEYHRRFSCDQRFAKQVLLGKLRRFTLGELGLEAPITFTENERDCFIQVYNNDTEFREICDNHNMIVRETLASWLEEWKQEDKNKKNG